ncbi:transcriptional regulator [Cereibacter sediminicola]|uniref:transcriptional regulator n=1 Tax=Cereibacter sediminicola TaxID=2584941 RepID=UPI0011A2A056|nr:transcriptional regulator [Cereibacter sediminicola]
MARPRSLPDAEVHDTICRMLSGNGDRAVSFGTVSRATGLAAATLAGRYRTRDGMVQAALGHFWDRLEAAAEDSAAETKATAFLKALGEAADPHLVALSLTLPELRPRAEAWRQTVEAGLALRLGRAEPAAMMFALWQGQRLWQEAGGRSFRLKDAARRLSPTG